MPLLLSGCRGTIDRGDPTELRGDVVMVKGCTDQELKDIGARALRIADDNYPRILEIAGTRKSPKKLEIMLVPELSSNNVAMVTGPSTISLNVSYFVAGRVSSLPVPPLDYVLVHEMAHVACQFGGNVPEYWHEGIADYVRYKIGLTNGWTGPRCTTDYPHYTAGYWCAGAFLLWVDSIYGSEVIRAMIIQFAQGKYSDAIFEKATGQSLSSLWENFQGTAYYMPKLDTYSVEAIRVVTNLAARFELPGMARGMKGELSLTYAGLNAGNTNSIVRTFTLVKTGSTEVLEYQLVLDRTGEWRIENTLGTANHRPELEFAAPQVE